jgi:hypothetical protein
MYVWKIVQNFYHAVVIFQGMEASPGKRVYACHQILVEGLVHVPEKTNIDFWHFALIQIIKGGDDRESLIHLR